MKRRLFLKTGSVGIGGMMVMPTVVYGCASLHHPLSHGPSKSVNLFTDGSRLFDAAIAELRTSGSGELASAEAEDVTLSGTGQLDIVSIGEQIVNKQAAVPAEVPQNFEISSEEMLSAAGEIYDSAEDLLPVDRQLQAELAEDFALLKVVKASNLLTNAAEATPHPARKVSAAENMINSAEMVHKAVNAEATSELVEGSEHLLAYSEEYVGACEVFSAEAAFAEGVQSFESSVEMLAESEILEGVAELLTSTDDIALSSEYYALGAENLNAEAAILGGNKDTIAEDLIPWAEQLVTTTPLFIEAAKGVSAAEGALEMHIGSAELLKSAEHHADSLGQGGEVLDTGADQFIGGEITYTSAEFYGAEGNIYLNAAENFRNNSFAEAEAKFIKRTTKDLLGSSENFYAGASALHAIKRPDGVESMVPAATEILIGAELLQSEAQSDESKLGAEKMVEGAAEALSGASESATDPAEFLESGAKSIELGTNTILTGAAEFVEGYK